MIKITNVCLILLSIPASADAGWERHTIDATSRGADGVRLADVNGDGWLDIVTAWEEGGVVRACFHPGVEQCRAPWPAVTVGKVQSGEDAVFVDLDGDGSMDVVSCCEGKTRSIFAHWAPEVEQYKNSAAWATEPFPDTAEKQMWMFAAPMDVDGRRGLDLAVSSKGSRGSIGWLEAPSHGRDLADWKFHQLRRAGWIMSLIPHDMDGDGDLDIVASDRKGKDRGVFWLENPRPRGLTSRAAWIEHPIGGERFEVMFLDLCDLDSDRQTDLLVATRNGQMMLFRSSGPHGQAWSELAIQNPFQVPHGKAVKVGDIDLDGRPDIVHSANTGGDRQKPGVAWMKLDGADLAGPWTAHDVSGEQGVKFDLVELYDIDNDRDLDILTCEERDGLGVTWYENPARR